MCFVILEETTAIFYGKKIMFNYSWFMWFIIIKETAVIVYGVKIIIISF